MLEIYDPQVDDESLTNSHAPIVLPQKEKDFGTPMSRESSQVTLSIDGIEVTVPTGTSVMRAAAELEIDIPRLCATDKLKSFGSCRICLVEIEGRRGFPAACTTPVEAGMQVSTQREGTKKLRRNVMELYMTDHPSESDSSTVNGDSEMYLTAKKLGLDHVRYGSNGLNHLTSSKDDSNPYFAFDPSACIVCSRCVRACDEVQGTFALTIEGRGFESKVSASGSDNFMDSECVSCGACVDVCPTTALTEKTILESGMPDRSVTTTCAYCGVGCSFKAEMSGDQVVRMAPFKEGKANEGHACVKGRFAFGYATHADRITTPMIRDTIDEPWREVSWSEAIDHAACRFKAIQSKFGRLSIGAISSSRCTNEEVYLVQKMVRAGFGNNNIDTCARVCHSPTGFGLKTTLGESAGTQTFASVADADVVIIMGANPTEAHPVFGSRLKRRLREGAKLIVIDPREIELVSSPHVKSDYHLPVRPGTNVVLLNALAHTIVTEGLEAKSYIRERCELPEYEKWSTFISDDRHSPENTELHSGVPAEDVRGAARLFSSCANGAIFYGLGVTEHSQGSTAVMAIANLAMLTGNLGRDGVGVNPLRGQNNVQGSCDMGSFPHELPGYRHISDNNTRSLFEEDWGVTLDSEPGFRIPNMFNAAVEGDFKGLYCQGEDIAQSDPNTQHVEAALCAMECAATKSSDPLARRFSAIWLAILIKFSGVATGTPFKIPPSQFSSHSCKRHADPSSRSQLVLDLPCSPILWLGR